MFNPTVVEGSTFVLMIFSGVIITHPLNSDSFVLCLEKQFSVVKGSSLVAVLISSENYKAKILAFTCALDNIIINTYFEAYQGGRL